MRITAIAALCVAPLALAGTLDIDLRSRGSLVQGNDLDVRSDTNDSKDSSSKDSSSNSQSSNSNSQSSSSNSQSSNNDNNKNNNNQITGIETTSTTEVIIIWVNPGNNAATTTVNTAAASTAAAAAAATHTVVVGGTTKVYTPDTIAAAVGDTVVFEFQQQNHTATTSNFAAPCVFNGGMDTGFMPNANGTVNPPPQVAMTVNVTTPIWFYCRQTGHCGEGMTFSINPTVNKTQAAFQALAIQQNGTGTAAPIAAPPAASSTVSVASAASSAAAAPPPASSSSSSSTGLTSGQGTVNSDGSCSCAVICAAGSIPNVAVQGLNSFGGMGGSVPASALEITA